MTLPARTLHADCPKCRGTGRHVVVSMVGHGEMYFTCNHAPPRDPTLMLSDDEEELLALRNEIERMKRTMLEAADMLDAQGSDIAAAKLREDVAG